MNEIYKDTEARNLAEKKLEAIAAILPAMSTDLKNFTVHEGWLGLSLFYCYYSRYTEKEHYLEDAARCLNTALELANPGDYNQEYPNDSYDYRLAGLGMFFYQVRHFNFLQMEDDTLLTGIDHHLSQLTRFKINEGDFSRFSGALASAHYFYYSEQHNPLRTVILKEIVQGLMVCACEDEEGDLFWNLRRTKDKIFFGSHGSAMVISFLAAMLEDNIETVVCETMLIRSVAFVLKHMRDQKDGLFPIALGDLTAPTQFSQCFGDLGIGYSLYRAATALNDQELMDSAMNVLQHCMNRKFEDGHTPDAGMTYGAAGVSQLFGKLSRNAAVSSSFRQAEQYWLSQLPKYAGEDQPYAGFRSALTGVDSDIQISFGWGIIGIGISMMRYLQPGLPDLDRFCLYF